ncbi:MAG: hypothetical protein HY307_04055 [Arcobacter sp.]|nr:hypothetical protein [Arcobacter sp.]
MVHTRSMLLISFIAIFTVYYFMFSFAQVINIVLDEYIAIGSSFILFVIYKMFKIKLKNKLLYELIPDLNYIPIKSALLFFVLFQCYDFYNENGLVGMIRLWFTYWIFGICANLIMHILNLYKNFQLYKKADSEIVTV